MQRNFHEREFISCNRDDRRQNFTNSSMNYERVKASQFRTTSDFITNGDSGDPEEEEKERDGF